MSSRYDLENPPLGVVILAGALAALGLGFPLTVFSVSGNLVNNIARGAIFESALIGIVFCGLVFVTGGFYLILYGLWTMHEWGWYGTMAILSAILLFELSRVLGYLLEVNPILFLLESQLNRPLVLGTLIAVVYLGVRRTRYLDQPILRRRFYKTADAIRE